MDSDLPGESFTPRVIRAVTGLRLAAIVERHGDLARQAYPDICVARSVDDLLSIRSIDLVVVAAPNDSHFQSRAALPAGRSSRPGRQPFATTSAEAVELVRLARERGRIITVFQNRRWDGDFLTIRRLLQDGTLGRPVLFESYFNRYRPHIRPDAWREHPNPGGGLWFDLGPHLLDQALVLFGLPDAITADFRTEREGALVEDAFDVVLHYQSMRAELKSSMLSCDGSPRFRLRGNLGASGTFCYLMSRSGHQSVRAALDYRPTNRSTANDEDSSHQVNPE